MRLLSLCGKRFLSHFGYKDRKPSLTLYDLSRILRMNKRIGTNKLRYSQIIRSLMYLTSVTRCDISFVVNKLSRLLLIQKMIIGMRLSE
jgi:phenylalanine-4-hydroxylase